MRSYLFNTLRYRNWIFILLIVVLCTSRSRCVYFLILKMIYYIFATLRENSVLPKAKHLYFWSSSFVLPRCLILLFKLNISCFSSSLFYTSLMKDEFFFKKKSRLLGFLCTVKTRALNNINVLCVLFNDQGVYFPESLDIQATIMSRIAFLTWLDTSVIWK
jgi:hypothetical protein